MSDFTPVSTGFSPKDRVCRLMLAAESLQTIAALLPEESGGLAHVITLLGVDIGDIAESLAESVPPEQSAA